MPDASWPKFDTKYTINTTVKFCVDISGSDNAAVAPWWQLMQGKLREIAEAAADRGFTFTWE